jgi:hypothetical protein
MVVVFEDIGMQYDIPPVSPYYSEVIIEDSEFENKCLFKIENRDAFGKSIRRKLLSKSEEFGEILRADLEVEGSYSGGNFQRAICWRSKESGDIIIAFVIVKSDNGPPDVENEIK